MRTTAPQGIFAAMTAELRRIRTQQMEPDQPPAFPTAPNATRCESCGSVRRTTMCAHNNAYCPDPWHDARACFDLVMGERDEAVKRAEKAEGEIELRIGQTQAFYQGGVVEKQRRIEAENSHKLHLSVIDDALTQAGAPTERDGIGPPLQITERGLSDARLKALQKVWKDQYGSLKRVMQDVFDHVEGDADGAPDATPHDQMCNRIAGTLAPFVEHKAKWTPQFKVGDRVKIKDDPRLPLVVEKILGHQTYELRVEGKTLCTIRNESEITPAPEPWAAEKKAHAEGKVIQWRRKESPDSPWRDCGNVPKWHDNYEYRVKPEPDPYRRAEFERDQMDRCGGAANLKRGDSGMYQTAAIESAWRTWRNAIDATRTDKTQPLAKRSEF